MNRTSVAVIATLIALIFVAGTGSVGFSAAPSPQQDGGTLDVEVWLSEAGDMDLEPVRLLAPGTPEAQVVLRSNLQSNDPQNYRVNLVDARGIRVFRSGQLSLGTGEQTTSLTVTGMDFFQSYTSRVETDKDELVPAVDDAIAGAEAERGKDPCAQDPGNRLDTARVIGLVNQAQLIRETVDNPLIQILRFDSLEGDAQTAFEDARSALAEMDTKGEAATDKLEIPDDVESCPDIDAPNWEPDWDAVLTDLNDMRSQASTAETSVENGLGLVDEGVTRSFPLTGIEGRCLQNTVQLQVAGQDVASDDFWFTVGTPGDPVRLANPEDPTASGTLIAHPNQIYSTSVEVSGVAHQTEIETLVLDAICLPVPDTTVEFTTPADSIVDVVTPQDATDANGVAMTAVNATDEVGNGAATVEASVNGTIASIGLTVIGPPDQLSLRLGGSEILRVPNYGVGSTEQVSAVVKDANDNDVADGTPVQFSINPSGDHSFTDNGEVTTSEGLASASLVFGTTKKAYTVVAESGEASDSQAIRVVGPPDDVEVTADPRVIVVNTPIADQRTSELTVQVWDAQDPPQPAPDRTVVEFEFIGDGDANWASFPQLTRLGPGRYQTTNLEGGQTTVSLLAESGLSGFRNLTVRVTAIYSLGGTDTSASEEVTVILRGTTENAVFLPLIRR